MAEDEMIKQNDNIDNIDDIADATENPIENANDSSDKVNDAPKSQERIETLTKQYEEMKDLAQRTQAEFMNYKKRTAKEKQDLTVFANENILSDLISVIDNFERALDSAYDKEEPLYKGIELIKKQLTDVLSKYGLEEIEALDEEFDPNYHHAVIQEEGETPNIVTEVMQKGYKLKNKVLRASMVKVSK